MPSYWTDKFSFVTGVVRFHDLGYLALISDEAREQRLTQSIFVEWDAGVWRSSEEMGRDWDTVAATVASSPLEQALFLGESGQVVCIGSGDTHEEQVCGADSHPMNRGPMRGIKNISGKVYAVGMNRQVYCRDLSGGWGSIDQTIRSLRHESDEVSGFEAVDGYDDTEIYAVGWGGEIWGYDGNVWSEKASPTNFVLVDVCCGHDETVYACGRSGVLVRGRGEAWEVIDHENMSDDIWSLAWYEGCLYLASYDSIYMLVDDGLMPINVGDDRVSSFFHLSVRDGVLWSVGEKDVVMYDGTKWIRID
jgi:hypothetical protein